MPSSTNRLKQFAFSESRFSDWPSLLKVSNSPLFRESSIQPQTESEVEHRTPNLTLPALESI